MMVKCIYDMIICSCILFNEPAVMMEPKTGYFIDEQVNDGLNKVDGWERM